MKNDSFIKNWLFGTDFKPSKHYYNFDMFYFENSPNNNSVESEKCQRNKCYSTTNGTFKVHLQIIWAYCNSKNYFSYTIMMSYNYRNGYAILSYLEYPIILVQEIILIICVLHYKQLLNIGSIIGASVYFSVAFAFISGIVPLGMLAFMVVSNSQIKLCRTVLTLKLSCNICVY